MALSSSRPGTSLILRMYFAVIAAVTLFTLMFGAINLLTVGLRMIIPGANQPEWGLEDCNITTPRYDVPTVDGESVPVTSPEELKASCEARNADVLKNWKSQQLSELVQDIALFIVSLPLFVVHFRVVYKDWKKEHED